MNNGRGQRGFYPVPEDTMKRNLVLLVAALLVTIAGATAQQKPPMVEVYKSPTCGCCSAWVDHLRDQGFEVRTIETDKVDELKATHRSPVKCSRATPLSSPDTSSRAMFPPPTSRDS